MVQKKGGGDDRDWIGRSVAGSGKSEVRRRTDAQPNQALDQEKHKAGGHEAAEQ